MNYLLTSQHSLSSWRLNEVGAVIKSPINRWRKLSLEFNWRALCHETSLWKRQELHSGLSDFNPTTLYDFQLKVH